MHVGLVMDSAVVLSNTFVLSMISRQRIFSDPCTSDRVHLSLGRLTDFSHQDPSVANDCTLVYCPNFLPNLPMSGSTDAERCIRAYGHLQRVSALTYACHFATNTYAQDVKSLQNLRSATIYV